MFCATEGHFVSVEFIRLFVCHPKDFYFFFFNKNKISFVKFFFSSYKGLTLSSDTGPWLRAGNIKDFQ